MDIIELKDYAEALIRMLPSEIYESAVSVFGIGVVLLVFLLGWKRSFKWCSGLLAIEYCLLILSNAVFYRETADIRKMDLRLFWTYNEIAQGDNALKYEIILNVVLFIPLGLLFGIIFRSSGWRKVFVLGCIVSCVVELMQLVMMRGLCEIDDVIHNTLGTTIGFVFYLIWEFLYRQYDKAITKQTA
mgnify:CR=1 FL=1